MRQILIEKFQLRSLDVVAVVVDLVVGGIGQLTFITLFAMFK